MDDGGPGVVENFSWQNTGADVTVYLVVDGYNTSQVGAYTLDVTLTP
jgi:hypothetical protein